MNERQKEMIKCAKHALLAINELKIDLQHEILVAKEGEDNYADYENYIEHLQNIDYLIRGVYGVSQMIRRADVGGVCQAPEIKQLLVVPWPPCSELPDWEDFVDESGLVGPSKDIAMKCKLTQWARGFGKTFIFAYPYSELDKSTVDVIERAFSKRLTDCFGYHLRVTLDHERVDIVLTI